MKAFPAKSNEMKSFLNYYPLGFSPVELNKKAVKLQVSPLFSTDKDRLLPKAGVNNPQPGKQHQPYFPCNV